MQNKFDKDMEFLKEQHRSELTQHWNCWRSHID